jgi:predicted membrane protein (TIGR00267 family)
MDVQAFYLRQGRYVILGSIDGLLAVLGIVMSLSAAQAPRPLVLAAGLGGAVALCLPNGLGSYLAESAVEYGRLAHLEDAMLTKLEDTEKETVVMRNILYDSLTHGGFSLLGGLVPLLPFLGLSFGSPTWEAAGVSVIYLVVLGAFSGKVSRKSMIAAAVKMVAMGLLIAVVTLALGAAH